MSDYTPTTGTVQATYAVHHGICVPCGEVRVSLVAEFDRWLHDLLAAAYTAGYRDRREERDHDPGRVLRDV